MAKSFSGGIFCALLAYFIWGVAPVYWKFLGAVPSLPLTAHRVVWSLPFVLLLISLRGRIHAYLGAFRDPRCLGWEAAAALLLALNWFAFIWAVAHQRILEVSLGYFLCPLLSVFLGYLLERERLGRLQCAALVCAALGILVLAFSAAEFPVAALVMAGSWATYGLIKKRSSLGALSSFGVEATLLLLPALLLLFLEPGDWMEVDGEARSTGFWLLLASTGLVTATPLLLFAQAAPQVRLSTMGMLQYMVPSMNFILAVVLYREPFTASQAGAFSAVWLGLILYSLGARRRRT